MKRRYVKAFIENSRVVQVMLTGQIAIYLFRSSAGSEPNLGATSGTLCRGTGGNAE
jgi:hypothetical protein